MLEYQVVFDCDLGSLIGEVNDHLAKGWRPEGGVCVFAHPDEVPFYYQALVRVVPIEVTTAPAPESE